MSKNPILALAVIGITALSTACGGSGSDAGNASTTSSIDTTVCTDLALHELKGNVKEVTKTTYFDVKAEGNDYQIIPEGTNIITSTARFDSDGHYIKKENELIKRDDKGRIVRWEDHRPNAEKVPGGFLKDTLDYQYINGNHLISTGMGQYAVVVYDDDNKIVGQYTAPGSQPMHTSAFNVYKKFDKNGNWTERVTIWSTTTGSTTKLHYSIDRRDITYY